MVETLVAVALVAVGTLGLAGATLSALAAARAAGTSARLAAAASAGVEVARAVAAASGEQAPDAPTLAWRADWVGRWQAGAAAAPWPLAVEAVWGADGSAALTAATRDGAAALRFEVGTVLQPPPDAVP